MSLNFNVDPYYDDFDPSKNYHRILFKPGYAVQARELTQSQTILQDQITKFADNIFKQNSPVTGGQVTTNFGCYYIKLQSTYNDASINVSDFDNALIQNADGTVLARVIATVAATGTGGAGDPPTLIVNYISGVRFTDNMTVYTTDNSAVATTIGVTNGTTCTGYSSVASISEGVFYIRNGFYTSSTQNEDGTYSKYAIGNFVSVQPQTTILDKYSNTPSYRVGLSITETMVDYIDDPSLLDPAIGASNYQAPGADRFKIDLVLATRSLTSTDTSQFIELARVENGVLTRNYRFPIYSVLEDTLARRTYDESGNYTVRPFNISLQTSSNTANMDVVLSPGKAYVYGYEYETIAPTVLTIDKPRSTEFVNNKVVPADYGNFVYTTNHYGVFPINYLSTVEMHCVAQSSINVTSAGTISNTKIGTARVKTIYYDSASNTSNDKTYAYKTFLFDVNANNSITGNVNTYSTKIGRASCRERV
mgnify:CR=1 FL=1